MKRILTLALGLAAAALLCSTRAQAQQTNDVQYASSTNTELSELYARLANLEARAASNNGGGGGGCGCNDCCCRSGFVAAGEIMWLKAYQSDGDFGDFNFREGYRFWVGFQGDSGLGGRLRYFDYFQRANNGDFINIYALDAEIYDNVELGCYWDLLVGAGFRVFGYEASDVGATLPEDALYGVGPVITAELYRHLGERAALYAIGRQSIIVGSGLDAAAVTQDTTGSVTELQLGLQVHTYWGDSLVFGRVGWETQAYYDIDDGEELVTLMGAAFTGGIMY